MTTHPKFDIFDACPLCKSTDGCSVQDQNLSLAGLGLAALSFGYCGRCGHIYQVRRASDDLLSRHYASYSNYTCFDPEAARKAPPGPLTRRLLTLAEARAPRGIAYEVGCATAYHMAHFHRAGWEVGGCDPSAKAVEQAKAIYDIDVDCGMDTQALPKRSDLAVILYSHVLEHMTDPIGSLRLAHGALRDDGVVLLEVPCATAPELVPPGWFTFEHLHYFSHKSLVAMLRASGFSPLEVRIAYRAEQYPVIAAIAAKSTTADAPKADPLAVAEAQAFLRDLVAHDDAIWNNTATRLNPLQTPVYVWGAGVHTAQLFDRTHLLRAPGVKAIIDRDSQKWGITQADCTVISPEDFFAAHGREPVVISSYFAEAQIARSLEESGIAAENIVRLYG